MQPGFQRLKVSSEKLFEDLIQIYHVTDLIYVFIKYWNKFRFKKNLIRIII
jgi:hypothetical protein